MDELIKQLGEKIDQMKTESVTKAEILETMSKIKDLETKGEEVTALKTSIEEVILRVLDLENKGVPSNVAQTLETLLAEKAEDLKAMKDNSSGSVRIAF